MGDKAVISRIAHRGVKKPVDLQCAAFLVHLVLDRLAADRHLNDDIDIMGSVLADRYSVQVHVGPPESPPPQVAVIGDIGVASFPSYRRSDHSAKAECDSIALLTAKGLARSAQNPAAQPAVEPDCSVVVRQRPDDEVRESMPRQILARRLEHTPPEAAALAFRCQVKLENLAAVAKRRHPIAPVADIADYGIAEFQHQQRRPARDCEAPPRRAPTRDHTLKLSAWDDAAIGFAPRGVMHRSDFALVAESRRANGYDRLDHGGMLSPRAGPPQGLDSSSG